MAAWLLGLGLVPGGAGAAVDAEDPCTCLKWSEVYKSQVECGEFAELQNVNRPLQNLSLQQLHEMLATNPSLGAYHAEKCMHWLPSFDSNLCLNVDGHAYSGWLPTATVFLKSAWCYVSSECQDLNGGWRIPNKSSTEGELPQLPRFVSAKICKPGQDRMLREQRPDELLELVRQAKTAHPDKWMLTLGIVFLESYKALHPTRGMWKHLQPLWRRQDLKEFPPELQVAVLEETPMIIYTAGLSHDHYKVLWGHRLIHLDYEVDSYLFGLLGTGKPKCPETHHCYRVDKDEL